MTKRSIIVSLLIAGALAFGVIKGLPALRDAIGTYRHVQQAALRLPGAEQDWRREFGDTGETLARYPRHEDSAAAVRLVELAHPVGIELARPKPRQADMNESSGERALWQAIGNHDDSELSRPGGKVSPPPDNIRAYLEAHERELGTLVDFLAESGPPIWESEVQLGAEAPIPNLLGQIRLHRLLAIRALSLAAVGQDDEAERTLLASWTLNESLRNRPEVISQLIAITAARMQMGLARRLLVDPDQWRRRFADHDYRASLLQAMKVEAVGRLRYFPSGSSAWDRASRADFLDLQRVFLVGLRDSRVSDEPLNSLTRSDQSENPKSPGAIVAMIALPNLANALRRVDRLIIDTELTDLILLARMGKASLGRWPTDLPGSIESRMAGARWLCSVGADGRLAISFTKQPRWQDQHGLILPLRYDG